MESVCFIFDDEDELREVFGFEVWDDESWDEIFFCCCCEDEDFWI